MAMSREAQDRQRIARLRQQQISERAPKAVKAVSGNGVKKKQRPLLIELFEILPARWKGIMLGLLLSLIPSCLISVSTTGNARILSIVPLLGLIAAGYIVGMVMQSRSEG